MARVDDQVVQNAFMDIGRLGLGHSRHPIRPPRLASSCYIAVALHADPEHGKATEGRSQSSLITSAVQKYVVDDDACATASNRGEAEIPRRFKIRPPWTDFDLPGFVDTKQGSIFQPLVGHRSDQVIDTEYQPGRGQHHLQTFGQG